MRLLSYAGPDGPRPAVVDGEVVRPIGAAGVLEVVRGAVAEPTGEELPLAGLEILSPLRPGKLIGIGLNYRDHAEETGKPVPELPLLFAKMATAVTGPAGPVVLPAYTSEPDFEGELAVVIGRTARDVPAARALDHVFGYAVMNDVSARDRQRAEPQWVRAKGADTFAPWGPWITTADEVPDPQSLGIRTWVSGDLMQDGTTADMVFSVAELIAFISGSFTLEPGDVITTGTPAGVGAAREPKRFLRPGDTVRVEIDGLGAIEHPVTAA
jgi:2-keto-4-pentenoate hydratase/2-oxohepta-3-ene-1,7-dioic acid hydratase in catechol pathway